MSSTQEAQAGHTDPQPATTLTATDWHADDGRLEEHESDRPRIIEEHHIVGPNGEDEIEAIDDRGRRWYDLRPEPRGAADVMGFNRTWWLVLWVIVVILLFVPWW
jgi:hypothetical protein